VEATAIGSTERAAVTRTVVGIVAAGAVYYLATRLAWLLTFPDSKVSLFFPPHAVMVSILLLVPTRRWWAYLLAALACHFVATQQSDWPLLYALQCEAFDGLKIVLTAAGIRRFIRTPLHLINLSEALQFVGFAVILVPFATALWGAYVTVVYHFGTDYWIEWRNLAISNAVTTIVLVPVVMIGVQLFRDGYRGGFPRLVEAGLIAAAIVAVGWLAFDRSPAGPDTSPALLYAPIPLLIWAALRFGLGGMSASMLIITSIAIWGTMQGRGPFLSQTAAENALALQLFILMAAAPLTLLAVAIEDERRSKQALRVTEQRMSLAAESAQLVLWDWDLGQDMVWVQDRGIFGFPSNAPVDHATLAGHVHPDDRAALLSSNDDAYESRQPFAAEFRAFHGLGESDAATCFWDVARRRGPVRGCDRKRLMTQIAPA